jgi:hypothetical protein
MSACLILEKSTLLAIMVHISMAIANAPWCGTWALTAIETVTGGFCRCGTEVVSGGCCLVAWVNVSCPTRFDGLGLPDLCTLQWLCWCVLTRTGCRQHSSSRLITS